MWLVCIGNRVLTLYGGIFTDHNTVQLAQQTQRLSNSVSIQKGFFFGLTKAESKFLRDEILDIENTVFQQFVGYARHGCQLVCPQTDFIKFAVGFRDFALLRNPTGMPGTNCMGYLQIASGLFDGRKLAQNILFRKCIDDLLLKLVGYEVTAGLVSAFPQGIAQSTDCLLYTSRCV